MKTSRISRLAGLPFALALVVTLSLAAVSKEGAGVSPEQAMQKLKAGNRRFTGQSTHPNQTALRRKAVSKGQQPFAIVVSCSDSRVPPEVVFDQGLGDLFVVRVAGNIVDDVGLGSIEYAADHLGPQLILVLGHERCGAVDATVQGGEATGHVASLTAAIKPAVDRVRNKPGDLLENSVKSNVELVVDQLKSSQPVLAGMVKEGKLKVVGGYYSLTTGKVEFLP